MNDLPTKRPRRPAKPTTGIPLWVTGLFVAALVGAMVWMTDRFVEYDKLQRCVTAGHRDCGPKIEPVK